MPEKRIILLLDGTWNDADIGVGDTNIVRLRRIITQSLDPIPSQDQTRPQTARTFTDQTGKKREHIIFYERGVGTGGFFDNIRGGGFGAGLARNIRRAYNFLSSHYELGDQVFIFGFSRGAYTARSLVGFIAAAGLLKSDSYSPANESRAWYYYRTSPYDRPRSTWNDLASCVHDRDEFRIECLGVFETVGALGVPLRSFRRENRDLFEFHDVELSHICKINLHALAVDEHRESFQATIWRQPQMTQIATITEQTWFAGAHADIGGGYIDEEERRNPELDDIPLDWMLKRLKVYYPDFPANLNDPNIWKPIDKSSSIAAQHEPRRGLYRLTPFAIRSVCNHKVKIDGARFAINVCYDRHLASLNERIHISVLQRLGKKVKFGPTGRALSDLQGVTSFHGFGGRILLHALLREHVEHHREIYYAPQNILTVLPAIRNTYSTDAPNATPLHVVDWSGEVLTTRTCDNSRLLQELLKRAEARLRQK